MKRWLCAAALLAASPVVAQVMEHDLPVQAMMATAVNPAALAFWAGGNDPPQDETAAAAEARWIEAVRGAQALQAKGRELQSPERTRPGRWNEFAELMADTGAEGESAAKARDAEKAFEIGGRLYDACNGCHKAYIPTPARLP